ncbi:MAG TPA: pyruvate, phosphate dikinase [bacterium]|nr:pyruvate, phosphate dikinase [bacterium]
MGKKYVYFFGDGKADGKADMKNLLGGKGANLAEMTSLGIPVPPGFTITTEVCSIYYENNKKYPKELESQVTASLKKVEKIMGAKYGDPKNPLLFSVRSGARQSMPGMMETVLNIGLTSKTIPGLVEKTQNPRFVYDAYRRLIMMYSDVVMEKAAGIEPKEDRGIRVQLDEELEAVKKKNGYKDDSELTVDDLTKLIAVFKKTIKKVLKKEFPDDPKEQLWGGINAVFQSWNGRRAIAYRRIEGIPEEWGTAVNVQTMVFGNMGDNSATGVAFTRNPANGDPKFYGEWLTNAQGEDVVAGTRTPSPLNKATKTDSNKNIQSLEEKYPKLYKQLFTIRTNLEKHYKDMQDIEFTIQEGRLWMLQTRSGKRNGIAAVRMAVDMANEKLIDLETAIMRVNPEQITELLLPMIDPSDEKKSTVIAKGLPAGPGGASGKIVLSADRAQAAKEKGEKVILVRNETSPEDVHGMHAAEAILTAKGGMTSHAALVARGWGKCCIVGCSELEIDYAKKTVKTNGYSLKEGDFITLNGTAGKVYKGELKLLPADPDKNKYYKQIMKWADTFRKLNIRTNADRPVDAELAVAFGAEGIGLCRTEHMFFGEDRINNMRAMILAETVEDREKALEKLLPMQKSDFFGIFKAMKGKPVTIRLLDPPLHEFLPSREDLMVDIAVLEATKPKSPKLKGMRKLLDRVNELHEFNPMLGMRGIRLGLTLPEVTKMQVTAIISAACDMAKKKLPVKPEIMIPLTGHINEMKAAYDLVDQTCKEVLKKRGIKVNYLIGTMIEIPRAAATADEIAQYAQFFSFGTNDLTQMTFGYSRDDAGKFIRTYLDQKILPEDPFQTLDQGGVGRLIKNAVQLGRGTRGDLHIGICGEHGGDPKSIEFCHRTGFDYVSCSPFRVPIARFAAAHAAIINKPAASAKPAKKAKKVKKAKK